MALTIKHMMRNLGDQR